MITKNKPKYLVIFFLLILWLALAPNLAMKAVMGKKIRKAGIFKKPILKGRFAFKYEPEIRKPTAPNKAIMKPMAAALPIALFIGYPKNLSIGTFITAPPIPIGAEINPLMIPDNPLANNPIFISKFSSFSLRKSK